MGCWAELNAITAVSRSVHIKSQGRDLSLLAFESVLVAGLTGLSSCRSTFYKLIQNIFLLCSLDSGDISHTTARSHFLAP